MYSNKNKFALWISPDVRELVDANYKMDCCRSRSDYIEKAIRFYTGYLHAEKAAAYLPRTLCSVLDRSMSGFTNRVAKLLFKQSVESNLACHLLAEDVDMSYGEYEQLRDQCIREVKQCHGELNFMDEQILCTEPQRSADREYQYGEYQYEEDTE